MLPKLKSIVILSSLMLFLGLLNCAQAATLNLAPSSGKTINVAGNLTISGNLTVTAASNNPALNVSGDVTISANTILIASTSAFNVGGNWVNSGTFTNSSGTVSFTKAGGTQTLDTGGTGAGKNFGNILHSGGGTLQLVNNNVEISGNFTNVAGTFDSNNLDISIGGSWSNTATFLPGAGTVTLNGTSIGNLLDPGTSAFNNLTFNGVGGSWGPSVRGDDVSDAVVPLNNGVLAVSALDSTHVYVGGEFTNAGAANGRSYLAMWNGSAWSTVGNAGDINGKVLAIAALDASHVYVGGLFTDVAGVSGRSYLAMWNGSAWSTVGNTGDINGAVNAIAAPDASHIYVGGDFTSLANVSGRDKIAMWNGSNAWSTVGSAGNINAAVYAIAAPDASHVYVGGDFINAAGTTGRNRIAMWNGSNAWSTVGNLSDIGSTVYALAAPDASHVYVGGSFTNAAGTTGRSYLAMWNGSNAWSTVGNTGDINASVFALAAPDTGHVYLGGYFKNLANIAGRSMVAMWSGSAWSMGGGRYSINNGVWSIAAPDASHIYVGGDFTDAGGVIGRSYLAMWNGSSWSTVGNANDLNGTVYAIAAPDINHVYVGGGFVDVAGVSNRNYIAMWNGSAWSTVGNTGNINAIVYAIAAPDASHIYVGGDFINAAGTTGRNKIAMWNGSNAWSTVGNTGDINATVYAIAAPDTGHIYVGGDFTNAGTLTGRNGIAMWNGSNAWSTVGNVNDFTMTVYAIAAPDTSHVYVGGAFDNVAGVTGRNKITMWNGGAWTTLGNLSDVNATVWSIAAPDTSHVYVGGDFTDLAAVSGRNRIAMWNGSNAWSTVGNTGDINSTVYAIAAPSASHAYLGGFFVSVGANSACSYLAEWDSPSWNLTLGYGASNMVRVNNNLTMTEGTMNTSNNLVDVVVNGNVIGTNGVINAGGTFTQRIGTSGKTFGNTSGSVNWSFNKLNFENSSAGDLTLTSAGGGSGHIIASGTISIGNSADTNTLTLDNEANDRIIDANGGVNITAKGVLQASSNQAFNVGGNWTNNGTFVAGAGTVVLNGSAKQSLSGALAATSSFYNLTISNASGASASDNERTGFIPGVDFNDNLTASGTFSIVTPNVRVEYESGKTYAFKDISWNGQATTSRIFFRNSTSTGVWLLKVTGTQSVSSVNVSRSDASVAGGSAILANGCPPTNYDAGSNVSWSFSSGGGGGLANVFYSVGQSASDLKSGSPTMDITGGGAVFSEAQTGNIGVGDKVTYNTSQTAYISAKTSADGQHWTLVTALGAAPADVTGATVNSIKHEFASLSQALANAKDASHLNTSDLTGGGACGSSYILNIPLYYDSGSDAAAVTVTGYTTSAANYIRIYTPVDTSKEANRSQRHGGKWDAAKYSLSPATGAALSIGNENVRVEGLEISSADGYGIYLDGIPGAAGIYISNCIIRGNAVAGKHGIYLYATGASSKAYISGNVVYGVSGSGASGIYQNAANWASYVYNNTVSGGTIGFGAGAGTMAVKNDIAQDVLDGFSGSFDAASDYNISSLASDASGANSKNSTVVKFVDAANKDFHLAQGDTAAREAGANLTADANFPLTADIDGQLRNPSGTGWDIGADEGTVEAVASVMQSGGDYSTLSSWEAGMQADLTATTTRVFSFASSSLSGTIADNATVVGQTSHATATVVHLSASSSQILLENIQGTFLSGETVQVSAGNSVVLSDYGNPASAVAKIDGYWTADDSSGVTIDGWTTGADDYIRIYTTDTARHKGKWDDNRYRLVVSAGRVMDIYPGNVTIDGLQMKDGAGSISAFFARGFQNVVKGNIVKAVSSSICLDSTGDYVSILNNIVYNCSFGIYVSFTTIPNRNAAYIFGNTVTQSSDTGIYNNFWTGMIASNNISTGNSQDYRSTSYSSLSANNISSDSTAPGTYSKTSAKVKFVDAANNDFRLSSDDTAARDAGTSTPLSFSSDTMYDIQGTLRGNAWDIGADEVPADFVSTICENRAAGGDCANMDYQSLSQWQNSVKSDIAATTTRVFSGAITGALNGGSTVYVFPYGSSTSTAKGYVVATTSGQILLNNIISSTSLPLLSVASGTVIRKDASNYWTVTGATTTDALGASPVAVAKIDGVWNNPDSTVTTIGWITDVDNYIKIYTTSLARHPGKWSDKSYRLECSEACVSSYESKRYYMMLDGLQIRISNGQYGVRIVNPGGYTISNNIITRTAATSSIDWGLFMQLTAIGGSGPNADDSYAYNNSIYGFSVGLNISMTWNGYLSYAYNNTIYNADSIGIHGGGNSQVVAKNNIVSSSTDPFENSFHASSTNNVTDKNDTPTGSTGTNFINQKFSFVSTASGTEDFHLTDTDSGAKDKGADLSNDANWPGYKTDIDGAMRNPDGLGWDIGADEVPVKIYRSIAPSMSSALATGGSNAMTVDSATRMATFASALPDNVGVGDVLVYNTSGATSTAFISGRSSSTAYTVITASGTAPVDASADTSWSLYRAYTTLTNAESGIENTGIPTIVRNFDDWTPGGDATTNDVGNNLVSTTSNMQWNIAAYAKGTTDETTGMNVSGWTTGVQNTFRIYTPYASNEVGVSQRPYGKPDVNKFHVVRSATTAIILDTPNIIIEGIQVTTSGSYRHAIYISATGSGNVYINANILSAPDSNCVMNTVSSGLTAYISNNILYNCSQAVYVYSGRSHYIYNNAAYNCVNGYYANSGAPIVLINNIAQNVGSGYKYYAASSDYNISSDGTAPGAHSKSSTTVQFVDAANNDFHLAQSDTAARGAGANLTNDANLPISTDIDGQLRNATGTGWDIGADEGTVEAVATVMQSGGDYSTLSSWESGMQCDLTATTTRVFSYSSKSGSIADNATVIGQVSHATGTVVHVSASSTQILLENIQGTFLSGETAQVTAGNSVVLSDNGNPASAVAKIDGAWSATDTAAFSINGWTTGADAYIRVYTADAARHKGKWDNSKYRLETTSSWSAIVGIFEEFVSLDGLQIRNNGAGNDSWNIEVGPLSDSAIKISNNIITNSRHSTRAALRLYPYKGNAVILVYDNILYDNTGAGIYIYGSSGGYIGSRVFNNTVYNSTYGVYSDSFYAASVKVHNNLCQNNASGDYYAVNSVPSSANNISSDATATGTNSKTNTAVNFADTANYDFHLSAGDTAAKDAGTSTPLASDPNMAYDIDGNARSDAYLDIGADEASTKLYRSVGQQAADLNTGAATVSVSTTTAVFSADLPANIGVGDAIQYGNPLNIAFISGRLSSSTYEVRSWNGGMPTATTTAAASVFRSHLKLADWQTQTTAAVNTAINSALRPQVLVGRDLVASNTIMMVPCYASTTPDPGFSISAWNTSSSSKVRVYTPYAANEVGISQRHNGKWDDSKFRCQATFSTTGQLIGINSWFVDIDGLQMKLVGSGDLTGKYIRGVRIMSNSGIVNVSHNLIMGQQFISGTEYGIMGYSPASSDHYIYDNVVSGFTMGLDCMTDSRCYAYNNTLHGNTIGINIVFPTKADVINNVSFDNIDDFVGAYNLLDHNASDDGDGTNAVSLGSSTVVWSKAFTDYANGDFSVRDIASPLYDKGVNVPGVKDDIIGTLRPKNDAYDIGAFEYIFRYDYTTQGDIFIQGDVKFD